MLQVLPSMYETSRKEDTMTQNFVEYLQFRENARSNLENEKIKNETNRINLVLGMGNLVEAKRHNTAVEFETNRHNIAYEFETHRSNLANETETKRHNLATEKLTAKQISLGYDELQLKREMASETQRHNLASESLSHYQTLSNYRAAMANVGLGYSQLAETARHNLAYEGYQYASLGETVRHNKRNEDLGYTQFDLSLSNWALETDKLNETKRHNMASESISQNTSDYALYGQIGNLLKGLGVVMSSIK